MKIETSIATIKEQLENKQARLERIAISNCHSNDSERIAIQETRISDAKRFINELEEIKDILDFDLNIKLVPKPTFEKQVTKADFASMEYDGEFCKIALIQNYPYDNLWLVYAVAIESI